MASQGPCVAIYNMDKGNDQILTDLKAKLTENCPVNYYKKVESYDKSSIGAIASTLTNDRGETTTLPPVKISGEDIALLTREELTSLLYDEEGSDPVQYDVIMLLGHFNIYHVGPFDTSDVIQTILSKHNPSVIALLGCCGGGTHYGPLLAASQMPSETIFGFYQRRIYPDELNNTSLVLGIRNYLHLQEYFKQEVSNSKRSPPTKRVILQRSFACAAVDIPLKYDDPSIFANDSDELVTTQNLLKVFHDKFGAQPIPLACLQLALFHYFTVEKHAPNESPTINRFIETISHMNDVNEIEQKCKRELEERQLDKIISLTAEILLLPVLEETLDKLKEGNWMDVDPLQFCIAVLHGYWGKNSYTYIRCCTQYHYNELLGVANNTVNENDIHRFQLGAITVCLFCENSFVNFDLPDHLNKNLTFYQAFPSDRKKFVEKLKVVERLKNEFSIKIFQKIPELNALTWENGHYKHMKQLDKKFITLLKANDSVSLSNYRKEKKSDTPFHYTTAQFNGALSALQKSLLQTLQNNHEIESTEAPYYIKPFINKDSRANGWMKCFKPWPLSGEFFDYKFAEMRVIGNNDTPLLSRCRFVYQFILIFEPIKYWMGTLYFTDSHYGWDLISEEKLDKKLKGYKNFKNELKNLTYFQKQAKLIKKDLYQLQDEIKETFPFDRIGTLRVWEDRYTLDED